jgi:hypothetical protein
VQASRGRLDLLRKIGIQSPSMSRREYLLGLRLGGKP